MMSKKSLFINIAIFLFLCIVLYVLTQNSYVIQGVLRVPQQLIAGASTNIQEEKETLPQELAKDAEKQLETVKKDVLNTSVQDIITFFSKSGKIVEDVKNLQKSVNDFLSQ